MSHGSDKSFNYELLEWLGDAVIDLLVTFYLFENIPNVAILQPNYDQFENNQMVFPSEGQLTEIKQRLTNNDNFSDEFANIFHKIYHKVNKSFKNKVTQIKSKVIADIFEALVAVIYIQNNCNLDKTWTTFKPSIMRIIKSLLTFNSECKICSDNDSECIHLADRIYIKNWDWSDIPDKDNKFRDKLSLSEFSFNFLTQVYINNSK